MLADWDIDGGYHYVVRRRVAGRLAAAYGRRSIVLTNGFATLSASADRA